MAGLTARQAIEVRAYAAIEGLPDWRADLRMARTCAAIMAAAGHKSRASDWMPRFAGEGGHGGDLTDEDGKRIVEAFNNAAARMRKERGN